MLNRVLDILKDKEGTKTITFAEIEEALGSDLTSLTAEYTMSMR